MAVFSDRKWGRYFLLQRSWVHESGNPRISFMLFVEYILFIPALLDILQLYRYMESELVFTRPLTVNLRSCPWEGGANLSLDEVTENYYKYYTTSRSNYTFGGSNIESRLIWLPIIWSQIWESVRWVSSGLCLPRPGSWKVGKWLDMGCIDGKTWCEI